MRKGIVVPWFSLLGRDPAILAELNAPGRLFGGLDESRLRDIQQGEQIGEQVLIFGTQGKATLKTYSHAVHAGIGSPACLLLQLPVNRMIRPI